MLRRLIDGAGADRSGLVPARAARRRSGGARLAIAAVIVWTVWRIHRLWQKYRQLLHELAAAEAAKLSDDPAEVERAERILRERRMTRAADMTLMSGFFLGSAASADAPMEHGHGRQP